MKIKKRLEKIGHLWLEPPDKLWRSSNFWGNVYHFLENFDAFFFTKGPLKKTMNLGWKSSPLEVELYKKMESNLEVS